MINYPLTIPSEIKVTKISFFAENVTTLSISPFTLKGQVQQHAGTRWRASISLAPMVRANGDILNAFLLSLKGSYGTFYLGDFFNPLPKGIATGSPIVNGSHVAGSNILEITGFTASTNNILKAGDFIQVANRLYKILQNVNSNGSGTVVADIFPNLRDNLGGSETVTTNSPKGIFRLTDNISSWEIYDTNIFSLSFSAVEAI